jgi:hypothetical protein
VIAVRRGGARARAGKRTKIAFAQVLDYDFVGLDRASAAAVFSRQAARVGRSAAAARAAAQLRCRVPDGRVQCWHRHCAESTARRVQHHGGAIVELTDPWAVRDLTICIRSLGELPPYARQLVEHLRSDASA